MHHPKIESYDHYLYLILHGIVAGQNRAGFVTQDVDFFLGPNYLVTVRHQGSRSIEQEQAICERHGAVLAEGPASLLHRIVDLMVDHYRPEFDALEDRLEELERVVFEEPPSNPLKEILLLKRDVSSLRRVTLPQRDALGRLARREFPQIPDPLAYRFRDVYDNLVRLNDDAISFQDRVTGLLDAYLSSQSNRLNQVMKVLTVIATIFMPLTVISSMWGVNVPLPTFPGAGVAVLVGQRHHGRDLQRCSGSSGGCDGCESSAPAAARAGQSDRRRRGRRAARRRSSRSWSRTPSTPAPGASRSRSSSAARSSSRSRTTARG